MQWKTRERRSHIFKARFRKWMRKLFCTNKVLLELFNYVQLRNCLNPPKLVPGDGTLIFNYDFYQLCQRPIVLHTRRSTVRKSARPALARTVPRLWVILAEHFGGCRLLTDEIRYNQPEVNESRTRPPTRRALCRQQSEAYQGQDKTNVLSPVACYHGDRIQTGEDLDSTFLYQWGLH